jgi:acetyl-CoA synthetase
MDSEDPLLLHNATGSTGKPKEFHTTAGYMVQTAYTFKKCFLIMKKK